MTQAYDPVAAPGLSPPPLAAPPPPPGLPQSAPQQQEGRGQFRGFDPDRFRIKECGVLFWTREDREYVEKACVRSSDGKRTITIGSEAVEVSESHPVHPLTGLYFKWRGDITERDFENELNSLLERRRDFQSPAYQSPGMATSYPGPPPGFDQPYNYDAPPGLPAHPSAPSYPTYHVPPPAAAAPPPPPVAATTSAPLSRGPPPGFDPAPRLRPMITTDSSQPSSQPESVDAIDDIFNQCAGPLAPAAAPLYSSSSLANSLDPRANCRANPPPPAARAPRGRADSSDSDSESDAGHRRRAGGESEMDLFLQGRLQRLPVLDGTREIELLASVQDVNDILLTNDDIKSEQKKGTAGRRFRFSLFPNEAPRVEDQVIKGEVYVKYKSDSFDLGPDHPDQFEKNSNFLRRKFKSTASSFVFMSALPDS